MTKQNTVAVIIPGLAIGRIICHMICNLFAPSIDAASSILIGMLSMKPLINQIA